MSSSVPSERPIRIDNLQFVQASEQAFAAWHTGKLDAVHITIVYHELFREMVAKVIEWNHQFEKYPERIFHGRSASDVRKARDSGRTAVFFGFQNPSPIEDDIGLVEVCHALGVRFMQLTYNNQSLLATGCYEDQDTGLTRMGQEVIAEMNRVGLVVDMSHSAEDSTFEAIEQSSRPIAITHANPAAWFPAKRNKSDDLLKALAESGGMLGLSLYPHHLLEGTNCTLESFCQMAADTAEKIGVKAIGIGSDLCCGQPQSALEWMRSGRWTKNRDFGEGSAEAPGFPDQPKWFQSGADFDNLDNGLKAVGFDEQERAAILGENWLRFYEDSFSPA